MNKEIVNATIKVLDDNPEWQQVYERYAKELQDNGKSYEDAGKLFSIQKPLVVYSKIGSVKDSSKIKLFDLRFAGQSVGEIKVNVKTRQVNLLVNKKQADFAKDSLGFSDSKELKGKEDWFTGTNAHNFRKFYYGLVSTDRIPIKSPEHRLESFLLKEFSKKTRAENKKLCNIQPVRLGDKFFQLTTPLKGSTHNPQISIIDNGKGNIGAQGGGIDILSHILHEGENYPRLAVIELKDQNIAKEPQVEVMEQALIYATFIAKLLRLTSCGKEWFNIFGFGKDITSLNHIDLDVISLMPVGSSKEGELSPIEIDGLNITLHPYTLYFSTDAQGNPDQFSGTLLEAIKK